MIKSGASVRYTFQIADPELKPRFSERWPFQAFEITGPRIQSRFSERWTSVITVPEFSQDFLNAGRLKSRALKSSPDFLNAGLEITGPRSSVSSERWTSE